MNKAIKQLESRLDGLEKQQMAWRADAIRYERKADDLQSDIDELKAAIAKLKS